ncbi:hypothetical protein BZG35_09290 [Brevundimonas sp. LM2]|uniref:hypothetical protein n=1 Tax=Brevundimonas sp. LM2 TaxID=1938605 RepID=UPI000983CAEE|nr:hypothetical protein [Brevundimonas sp. LM2]AQR61827.1 hypothetical protein BZG35_09290 [Brevundimonas sp. LM2]
MTPTLIVLGLLIFGVAIVVFATRQRGPGAASTPVAPETGWDAPLTPADAPAVEALATGSEPEGSATDPAPAREARP